MRGPDPWPLVLSEGPEGKAHIYSGKHSSLRCRKLEVQVGPFSLCFFLISETYCLLYSSEVHSHQRCTNTQCVSLRTLQPFSLKCCSLKCRAVMKMRSFLEMEDAFGLSLNIFTVQSPLRISCRDTWVEKSSSAADVCARRRLFSF